MNHFEVLNLFSPYIHETRNHEYLCNNLWGKSIISHVVFRSVYSTFHKHADSKVYQPPSQLCLSRMSIIITALKSQQDLFMNKQTQSKKLAIWQKPLLRTSKDHLRMSLMLLSNHKMLLCNINTITIASIEP